MEFAHEPVLLQEVLEYLGPGQEGVYVDCTLGGGGHAEAVLSTAGQGARLIGLDRDPEAIEAASEAAGALWPSSAVVQVQLQSVGRRPR